MMSRLVLLLALSSLGVPSPLEDLEKEMQKEGIDLDKVHEELKRESKEVEEEFSDKATQDQLSKLRAAYPSTPNGTIQEMTELEINGDMANDLFEGDIVLSPEQWARALDSDPNIRLQRRQAITDLIKFWQPMGAPVIPYTFKKGFPKDKRSIITQALNFWKSRTCVKFRSARKDDENVLEFNHNSTLCSSSVGMRGGKQTLNLGPNCFSVSTVAHELSHAFGTLHVQSRSDRDAYIIVDTDNIEEGMKHNFMKDPQNFGKIDNYGIPYELGSMQHYHQKAFAINRTKPTIYARPEFAKYQGSMDAPRATFYDTLLINKMYKCTDNCKKPIKCKNNGVQDGSKCTRCFCPKGWAGKFCEKRPADAEVTKLTANQKMKMEVPAGTYIGYQEKLIIIEAPAGKRIQAVVSDLGDYFWPMCRSIGMEIVPTKDTRLSGFRFCGKPDPTPIVSDSNQMLFWLYNNREVPFWADVDFTLV